MKGFVIRKSDGVRLIYGRNAPGTKVARLALDAANEFIPGGDARAADLHEAMKAKPKARKSLTEVLIEKGVIARSDLA